MTAALPMADRDLEGDDADSLSDAVASIVFSERPEC